MLGKFNIIYVRDTKCNKPEGYGRVLVQGGTGDIMQTKKERVSSALCEGSER